MDNHILNTSRCEKDIGIFIDDELKFDTHINHIVNKANRILAICKRTFASINIDTFRLLYKGLIRPQLEYASSVWSPHLIRQIDILEKVQKRATKLVPGLSNLSYPDRLKTLKLPTLKYRRTRGEMINLYKLTCEEGGFDKTLPFFLTYSSSHLRGHTKKLFLPRSNKDIGKFSFCSRTVKLWNCLPQQVVDSPDIKKFETNLDNFWQAQEFLYNHKADAQCY
jgi:hypothetical protein